MEKWGRSGWAPIAHNKAGRLVHIFQVDIADNQGAVLVTITAVPLLNWAHFGGRNHKAMK